MMLDQKTGKGEATFYERLRRRSVGERALPYQTRGDPSRRSVRVLLYSGSALRIVYGVGALLKPTTMVSGGYAPNTHDLDDPRLLLRAFGGHQLVTGCMTFCATRSRRLARQAATFSLLIDTLDVVSAVLEQRSRGQRDQTVTGGYVISGAGMIAFATALFTLDR
jgi:hypothetical protein